MHKLVLWMRNGVETSFIRNVSLAVNDPRTQFSGPSAVNRWNLKKNDPFWVFAFIIRIESVHRKYRK